jgi:hypothetical protein
MCMRCTWVINEVTHACTLVMCFVQSCSYIRLWLECDVLPNSRLWPITECQSSTLNSCNGNEPYPTSLCTQQLHCLPSHHCTFNYALLRLHQYAQQFTVQRNHYTSLVHYLLACCGGWSLAFYTCTPCHNATVLCYVHCNSRLVVITVIIRYHDWSHPSVHTNHVVHLCFSVRYGHVYIITANTYNATNFMHILLLYRTTKLTMHYNFSMACPSYIYQPCYLHLQFCACYKLHSKHDMVVQFEYIQLQHALQPVTAHKDLKKRRSYCTYSDCDGHTHDCTHGILSDYNEIYVRLKTHHDMPSELATQAVQPNLTISVAATCSRTSKQCDMAASDVCNA